jgi:hemolysin activation/secretion protein
MNVQTALLTFCALVPLPVHGIGADEASQPTPPNPAPQERAVVDEREPSGGKMATPQQVLLPHLQGLVIAPSAAMSLHLQSTAKDGVRVEGFSSRECAAIQKLAEKEIGRPVSLDSLERLSTALELEMRKFGGPMRQVSYPPQEITGGIIAVMISPALAGKIALTGQASFGQKFTAHAFRTQVGQEIQSDVILEDLDWLNENPLRQTSLTFRKGESPDRLDLLLKLHAPKPWRAYLGVDNQLSDQLGDERLFMGFQHGNVLSLDHRVTAQYTRALDEKRLQGISGIYEIPLPWRHLLEVASGYTTSEADSVGPIDQSGDFSRLALAYRMPLPRWHAVTHEARLGAEFRDNQYTFSTQSDATVRFFQIETGWKARRADRYGLTTLDASLQYSPGKGILGSEDADFQALGADGAESWIAQIKCERTWKLGEMGSFATRTQAQWADSELLSSDQLSAGGANRVRGFDESVGYASTGAVGSLEWQTPHFTHSKTGDFQGIAFVDAAVLEREQSGDIGQLTSLGLGLHWRYAQRVTMKMELGIPVDAPSSIDEKARLHFSVSTSW